jgi:TonB family protein
MKQPHTMRYAAYCALFLATVLLSPSLLPAASQPSGRGMIIADIDPATGAVTECHMLKSTGDLRADRAAVHAFSKWRFKPHKINKVRGPVTLKNGEITFGFGRPNI